MFYITFMSFIFLNESYHFTIILFILFIIEKSDNSFLDYSKSENFQQYIRSKCLMRHK